MKPRSRNNKHSFLLHALFFFSACASYILAFPVGSSSGIGVFSLITFTFFLIWMETLKLNQILTGGALGGVLIHLALTPWLGNYHPFALILSLLTGALRFLVLFFGLHLVSTARPLLRRIASVLLITCMPILSSWGFLAFPYATLPSSMDSSRFAFFLASLGGTSLVSLVIAAINYLLYEAFKNNHNTSMRIRVLRLVPVLSVGLLFLIPAQSYRSETNESVITEITRKQAKKADTIRVALIQPDMPQRQNALNDYKAMFSTLRSLSDKAKEFQPDVIVWHETSIVPALAWHLKYRPERETFEFAKEVQEYLLAYPSAVLLGTSWVPESDAARSSDYNSAILYDHGAVSDVYSKMKLVPFSEYFPWPDRLPGLARWLVSRFGVFRSPGTSETVFKADNARFAAPICFEDSFSSHFTSFPQVDFFAVLTEDSWAKSGSMQKQHALMSKYRAAETGSVVLRAANTGNTMAIEPNGHVSAALDPFTPGFLIVDIKNGNGKETVFELFGKYLATVILIASSCLLGAILFGRLRTNHRTRQ